jgi:hypothetical protein
MATTLKQLIAPQQIAASATTYYTVPTNKVTVVRALTLCNTTGTGRTVDIHFVPSGGSADATNQIVDALSVPSTDQITVPEALNHVLPAGATIQAVADAATAVTITASGVEVA